MPTELMSLSAVEIAHTLSDANLPLYRGKQILRWLHKGAGFEDMVNLPKSLITQLSADYIAQSVNISKVFPSHADDTVKFLYQLTDHHCVEGVLIRYRHGNSLCVSSQVGCRMGCVFCASTFGGNARNLSAGEIIGQIIAVNRFLYPEKGINHIDIMGSGEPFDNYGNTVKALRLLKEEDGLMIGMRNVSLSTCGLVPEIYRFAEEKLPVTLCVSLHAPRDDIRKTLMPAASRYPIKDILNACRHYFQITGRRVIFEYLLISGVNTSVRHALDLAEQLRGLSCHVNLISLNPITGLELQPASETDIKRFIKTLEQNHVSVTRRRMAGNDIGGACGQLMRSTLNN